MSHILRGLVLCLFGAALMMVGQTLAGEPKSWLGEMVLPTKPHKDIKFGDRIGDQQVAYPFSGRWPFKVREEREGWLRLHDGSREGWVDKADFVLGREALAYFTRRFDADPADTFALNMRGAAWMDRKEYDKALADFDEAIRLKPMDTAAFNNRGLAWAAKKNYDKAIADYDEALRINPKNIVSYANRGVAWRMKNDFDKAIASYDEAIRLDPRFASAYYHRGIAWFLKKDYDKAIDDYTESIRLDPKQHLTHFERGGAWRIKKDYTKALADYDEAIRLNPRFAAAFQTRGLARRFNKQYDLAIKDYEEAMRLDPKLAPAFSQLAWLLATCPDAQFRNGKRAVELATTACELTNSQPGFVDVLAAAHAEAGNFDQAVKYARQALESPAFAKQAGAVARARLKLYEEKMAYREK